jgi:hypothetical protein
MKGGEFLGQPRALLASQAQGFISDLSGNHNLTYKHKKEEQKFSNIRPKSSYVTK